MTPFAALRPRSQVRHFGRRSSGVARSQPATRESLVIIGNGMAGFKLCERLVAAGGHRRFRIVVFGEERRPAYDRVNLTDYFRGRGPDQLLLASEGWYAENEIELHLHDPVRHIDRDQRGVRSETGLEVPYDKLVFATGSRAFMPSIPGCELPGVYVYRTLEDLEQIKAHALFSRRAAVLGGGLLGLEAAHALHELGLQTWIVERGTSLLARQLDPQGGMVLREQVERLGLRVCTERETERIDSIGPDRLLQFNTGECLRVQLVVIAAGIRPRDELATASGLEIGRRGGIRVDDFLRSSDPNIYAIGECASHNGICYGLAAPGYKMADLLAKSLLGKRAPFEGCDQSIRLKLPGIEVATLGDYQANGETVRWQGKGGYRRLTLEKGRLLGTVSVGAWSETNRVFELIERRARLWRRQRDAFSNTGRIWKEEASFHVSQWPEKAIVCNCVGVRRGELSGACVAGCATIEQLSLRTGASTVCGACRPLLAELLGAPPASAPVPGLKLLGTTAVLACALALAFCFANPIPYADSVQSMLRRLDVLWREFFWKEVTGFTLVGLAATSLVLSLRKRVKRLTWGAFGSWRAIHGLLGALTLVALVSHTGFRLGHNLNLVLASNFLALALAGALAGAFTAWERRMGQPAGGRLRRAWTRVHVALAWPLPVLIIFHVVVAYYF